MGGGGWGGGGALGVEDGAFNGSPATDTAMCQLGTPNFHAGDNRQTNVQRVLTPGAGLQWCFNLKVVNISQALAMSVSSTTLLILRFTILCSQAYPTLGYK